MLKWCCDVVLTLEWRHYNVASLFSNKGLNVINREKKHYTEWQISYRVRVHRMRYTSQIYYPEFFAFV